MKSDDNEPAFENVPQDGGDDLKKKIAEQSLKSADQVHEDPSRSSLHYGEDDAAEDVGSVRPEGAQDDAMMGVDADSSMETVHQDTGSPQMAAPPEATSEFAPITHDADTGEAPTLASRHRTDSDRGEGMEVAQSQLHSAEAPAAPQSVEAGVSRTEPLNAPTTVEPSPAVSEGAGSEAEPNEAPTDIALSNSAVAENVEGAVVGYLQVSDANADDTHSFEISDDRFEVVDGAVKLKEGVSLSHDEASNLNLEITAFDPSGASVTQSFDVSVVDMPDVSHETGFHARYFDTDQTLRKLDDVDWQSEPTHQELVSEVDYKNSRGSFWEGGSKDTFGVQITGNIEVEEGGTFDFHIGGDDGVVLYVNGVEVIDNDGLHGFRTRSGEIELEPGSHVIEVRYFENRGHAGLKLEWEGPGTDGREVLEAPTTEDMQTVSGMPLSVKLDIEASDADATHMVEGLPPGSTVSMGEHLLEVGEAGSVDVTGMDLSLMHITPPADFTGDVSAVVSTTVTVGEDASATQIYPISFEVNPADITPPTVDVQTGFKASYFDVDHRLKELDDIDWSGAPTHEEVVSEINYENGRESFWEGGSTDTFGARLTGEVTIEEGGAYNFFLGGDDGVVLFINGEEVIDNDGLHGFQTRTGEIKLEPGTHEIEVRYFENYGHAGLKLEWEGPDTDGREVVQADSDLEMEANGAMDIRLETADLGDNGTATLSGLPADTILVSGEMTAVSDGSDISLDGWNLDLLEIMPPPGFAGEINADVTVSIEAFNGQIVETTSSFQISVEGDAAGHAKDGGPDDLILMEHPDDMNFENAGWVEIAGTEDLSEGGASDDEIMQEAVVTGPELEQSGEVPETYERQDW